jgi:DNA-binding NtrC family response regulator
MNRPNCLSASILIVDDDEDQLGLLCALLTNEGYRCIAASSPTEAISACKRDDAIDLVVSDFNMPTMNGLELWHVIRHLRPNLGVLFISGNLHACDILRSEGFPCLEKPFSLAELASRIRSILMHIETDLVSAAPAKGDYASR